MFMGEYQPKQGGKQSLGNQITQRRHSRLPCRKWWRMSLGALASSAAKGIPDLSYFRFEPEEMFAFELWTIWSFPKIGVPPAPSSISGFSLTKTMQLWVTMETPIWGTLFNPHEPWYFLHGTSSKLAGNRLRTWAPKL